MYQEIFKVDAPAFWERAISLITINGDWYVGEYFSYVRIWGSNVVHLLPGIVPDQMVLQEITYQTIVNGVFPNLASSKRKS